jgi:L-cysteine desulfidase
VDILKQGEVMEELIRSIVKAVITENEVCQTVNITYEGDALFNGQRKTIVEIKNRHGETVHYKIIDKFFASDNKIQEEVDKGLKKLLYR